MMQKLPRKPLSARAKPTCGAQKERAPGSGLRLLVPPTCVRRSPLGAALPTAEGPGSSARPNPVRSGQNSQSSLPTSSPFLSVKTTQRGRLPGAREAGKPRPPGTPPAPLGKSM